MDKMKRREGSLEESRSLCKRITLKLRPQQRCDSDLIELRKRSPPDLPALNDYEIHSRHELRRQHEGGSSWLQTDRQTVHFCQLSDEAQQPGAPVTMRVNRYVSDRPTMAPTNLPAFADSTTTL